MDSSCAPILDGKTKDLFRTDDPAVLLMHFKDAASAYGGLLRGEVPGKGIVNNRVSNHLMRILEEKGIRTQYLQEQNDRETLVHRLKMLPLEIIIRDLAAGSLKDRLGLPEGQKLAHTVL